MFVAVLDPGAAHGFAYPAVLYKLPLLDADVLDHHYIYLVAHRDSHIRYLLIVHLLYLRHIRLAVIRLSAERPQSFISWMLLIPHRYLSCTQVILIIGLQLLQARTSHIEQLDLCFARRRSRFRTLNDIVSRYERPVPFGQSYGHLSPESARKKQRSHHTVLQTCEKTASLCSSALPARSNVCPYCSL